MNRANPAKPTVLLVEDDPVHVEIVRHYLKRLQGQIGSLTVVGRLEDAIAHIDGHGADVVLLDLSLPDSPREQTIQRIGELSHGGATVIAMSALRTPEVAQATHAAAFVDKADLGAELIGRVLERHQADGAPRVPERTAQLTAPRPPRLAEELDVSRLAAGIAHDANSWLTNQAFRLAALESQPALAGVEDAQGHLASLQDSTRALTALVASALAIVQDETAPLTLETVDLEEWLGAFAADRKEAAGRGHVTLTVPAPSARVIASPNGLACVFEALLANAGDPKRRNGTTVEVRSVPGTGCFDIVDDGGPWNIERAENLTDPLVTGVRGSVDAGLGLFRARRWMERMGGSLALVERDDAPGAYAVRLTFDAK